MIRQLEHTTKDNILNWGTNNQTTHNTWLSFLNPYWCQARTYMKPHIYSYLVVSLKHIAHSKRFTKHSLKITSYILRKERVTWWFFVWYFRNACETCSGAFGLVSDRSQEAQNVCLTRFVQETWIRKNLLTVDVSVTVGQHTMTA